MKKIIQILIISLVLLITNQAYAVTYYAINAGGNWTAGGTWSTIAAKDASRVGGASAPTNADTCYLDDYSGSVTIDGPSVCLNIDENTNGAYGGTLAFGTQTLSVTGAAILRGAMTNISGTIRANGGVTLAGTPTGTCPVLSIDTASTLTSGGFTWPGALTFNVNGIIKLAGAWINTGVVTYVWTTNLNYDSSSAETLTCNGGLMMSANSNTTPTATIILGGGTWSGNKTLYNNFTINCTTATISGSVRYNKGILTYTAGAITTTGSTLFIDGVCTIQSANIGGTTSDVFGWIE